MDSKRRVIDKRTKHKCCRADKWKITSFDTLDISYILVRSRIRCIFISFLRPFVPLLRLLSNKN